MIDFVYFKIISFLKVDLPFDVCHEVGFCITITGQMCGFFISSLVYSIGFCVVWMGVAEKNKTREEPWLQCGTIAE